MTHEEAMKVLSQSPIRGVRYNIVRRAAHKSAESMLEKVELDMRNGRADEWFARWRVEVTPQDVERFRRTCLDPVLENLCDDYGWWADCFENGAKDKYGCWEMSVRIESFAHHTKRHYRLPYGIYSPVHEGGFGDVDNYLETGDKSGLRKVTDLFPELSEGA